MNFETALEKNDSSEILRHMKNGVELNKKIGSKYPIFFCIKNQNMEMIETMLNYGADVNVYCNETYYTPITYAGTMQNRDIIRLLISYGAQISFFSIENLDANYNFIDMNNLNLHSELIYWYYNWNPFHTAYNFRYVRGVKYILKNGLFEMKKEYLNYFKNPEDEKQRKIKYILNETMKKWCPHRHLYFHKDIQKKIELLTILKKKIDLYLPNELWFKIFEFII